jgi:anti-sigma regulatory factor (Ser/Thr protein kinase)
MKEAVKITVPSHPKYLGLVRKVTFAFGQIHQIETALMEDIRLAVDEACANVIRHAYRGDPSGRITLVYEMKKEEISVTIDDNGIKADMNAIKGRDLDEIKPGGLGVHFIRRVFDVFRFDEQKKSGNRLILIKKVST